MRAYRRAGTVAINGLLILGLVGLLAAYLVAVNDLPSQLYTAVEREYLDYNSRRSLSQLAPTWHVILPGSEVGSVRLPVRDSRVRATLSARYEEQDSVSVTVYDLDFYGVYQVSHTGPLSTTVELFFPFPDNLETLHGVRFTVDGTEPVEAVYTTRGMGWQAVLAPDEEHQIEIRYQADGANSFSYGLQHDQRADTDVVVTVDGLAGSQVPRSSLPASASEASETGEVWTWDYEGLIADRDIRLDLPARHSLAQRVARLQGGFRVLAGLAPLLVGLFIASLAGVLRLGGVRLPLESYLLAGCGLALFYPLLTFLSGIVELGLAAAVAVPLVSALLIAFLGLTVGWRQSGLRVGVLLVIYLGFFSLGVLTSWRGLLLSLGGLLLIGTFMLLYARRTLPEPAPPSTPQSGEDAPEARPDTTVGEAIPEETDVPHCPFCSRALAHDYGFCPGCGHDVSTIRRCAGCGHRQLTAPEVKAAYCVRCGAALG